MKKRKARNCGIVTLFLVAFLFIATLAFAGPDSKISATNKSTTEKKVAENKTETIEKADTQSSTQKISTPKTAVKAVKVKNNTKNNTTNDEKVKSTVKKTAVKTSSNQNKTVDSSSRRQTEKNEVETSNVKKNTSSQTTNYKDRIYNPQTEKNRTSSFESIKSSETKSIIPPRSSSNSSDLSDNEKIRNFLKDNPHGTSSHNITPRQELKPEEIEVDHENIEIVIHNNIEYRYYYGYYYRPWDGFYRRVWPPFGFRIFWLPPYYYAFWWRDVEYYYSCNVYYVYMEEEDEYVVVRPPIGAVVESIPDYSEKVLIDEETYFIADGIQYKAVLVNDEVWFKVIKVIDDSQYDDVELPVGSLVEVLPEDREVIYIEDETYYMYDDVQFKAVIVNDEIWFKVMKVG